MFCERKVAGYHKNAGCQTWGETKHWETETKMAGRCEWFKKYGVRHWRKKNEDRRECAGTVREAKVKFKRTVLLYVHPMLGNVLVNKFPRRQILGKQSVARLHNNRWGYVFYAVCAKQQRITGLYNPFLSNGWVKKFPRIGPCYESSNVNNNRGDVFRWVCAEYL
jgi:hypothetical protein